jgi:hypothetical protein
MLERLHLGERRRVPCMIDRFAVQPHASSATGMIQ